MSIAHIHQSRVSVREHAQLLRDRLRRAGSATFTLLVADCENTLEVVARFLALLELYREGLIEFEQPVSLDELTVRWVGGEASDAELDIDDYEGSAPEPDTAAEPLPGDESEMSDEVELPGSDGDWNDLDGGGGHDGDLDGGGSGGGGVGAFGAIVSDLGDLPAGRFDVPEDRLDLGGDDDAASAAVEEERS